jgi:hypothetical protein
MPLPLPKLDDRRFADLVEEARRLIPNYAPEWTNHNPSDPGITLIELFAYLTEMLIYRLDRVTVNNKISFLRLLNGPDWQPSENDIGEDVRVTIKKLRKHERAITCEDYELLALEADTRVARVHCEPRRNFQLNPDTEAPGHISLTIVPLPEHEAALANILKRVKDNLEPRRLLTTQLHVVEPIYLPVDVEATIVPMPDEVEGVIKTRVENAIRNFLHPLGGGDEGREWPFGRNVFVSEIYELLDRLTGVDFVTNVELSTSQASRRISEDSELIGLAVKPYELVRANSIAVQVQPRPI